MTLQKLVNSRSRLLRAAKMDQRSRHRVCPDLACSGIRILLHGTFPIKEHGRSLFQVISRPGRQFRDSGITVMGKCDPGFLHLMGELYPFGGITCHELGGRILCQIPDENPIERMGCSPEQGRVPIKPIHPDWRSLVDLSFRELDRWEDKLVKGQQREQAPEQWLLV